jgi:hypothetical protein
VHAHEACAARALAAAPVRAAAISVQQRPCSGRRLEGHATQAQGAQLLQQQGQEGGDQVTARKGRLQLRLLLQL